VKIWQKHLVTSVVVLTMPIWIVPFLLGALLLLLYGAFHDSLWRDR
jgi:hypothetical protein